jgi:hypothetical protein
VTARGEGTAVGAEASGDAGVMIGVTNGVAQVSDFEEAVTPELAWSLIAVEFLVELPKIWALLSESYALYLFFANLSCALF